MRAISTTPLLLVALSLSACGGSTNVPDDAAVQADDAATNAPIDAPLAADAPTVDAGVTVGTRTIGTEERPARLLVPPAHDGTTPLPLLVLLHGYGASAVLQDGYFGTTRVARELGVYLVLPDGTVDAGGRRFWNAGACCDFGGVDVDDVGYLTGLLDEVEALVPVDTDRVYFLGHSNGGFMSYRMACELSDRITAVAALAGTEATAVPCTPTRPVSVLHMHGTADPTILYEGGTLGGAAYLSADDVVAAWRTRDACTETATEGPARDFDSSVVGSETAITTWSGCGEGSVVERWRLEGSGHIPPLGGGTGATTPAIFEWLLARRGS